MNYTKTQYILTTIIIILISYHVYSKVLNIVTPPPLPPRGELVELKSFQGFPTHQTIRFWFTHPPRPPLPLILEGLPPRTKTTEYA